MAERCHDNVLGHLRALAAGVESDEHHRLLVRFSEADAQMRQLKCRRGTVEALRAARALQRRADGSEPPGLPNELRRLRREVEALDQQGDAAASERAAAEALLRNQVQEFAAAHARRAP